MSSIASEIPNNSLRQAVLAQHNNLIGRTVNDFNAVYLGEKSPLTPVARKYLADKLQGNTSSLFEITQQNEGNPRKPRIVLNISLTNDAKRLLHQVQKVEDSSRALETERNASWDQAPRLVIRDIRTATDFEQACGKSTAVLEIYKKDARERFNKWLSGRPEIINKAKELLREAISCEDTKFPSADSNSLLCSSLTNKLRGKLVRVSEEAQPSEKIQAVEELAKSRMPIYRRPSFFIPIGGAVAMAVIILAFKENSPQNITVPQPEPSSRSLQQPSFTHRREVRDPLLEQAILEQERVRAEMASAQQEYLNAIRTPTLRFMIETELNNHLINRDSPTPYATMLNDAVATIEEYVNSFDISPPSFNPYNPNEGKYAKALDRFFLLHPEVKVNPFLSAELKARFGLEGNSSFRVPPFNPFGQ